MSNNKFLITPDVELRVESNKIENIISWSKLEINKQSLPFENLRSTRQSEADHRSLGGHSDVIWFQQQVEVRRLKRDVPHQSNVLRLPTDPMFK